MGWKTVFRDVVELGIIVLAGLVGFAIVVTLGVLWMNWLDSII